MNYTEIFGGPPFTLYCAHPETTLIQTSLFKIGFGEAIELIKRLNGTALETPATCFMLKFINQGFSNTVVLSLATGEMIADRFVTRDTYILKVGKFEDVENERKNYSAIVEPSKFSIMPRMVGAANIIHRWSAILYEIIQDVETLADLYCTHGDSTEIVTYIDKLFTETEATWYQHSAFARQRMLTDQYNLIQSIPRYQLASREISPTIYNREYFPIAISGKQFDCINPIHYLLHQDPASEIVAYSSIVHGDMHGANILIDRRQGKVFLIDFANVEAHGNLFKDYVKLEANILFRLYDYDVSKNDDVQDHWLRLFAHLLGLPVDLPTDRETQKALECILCLRGRARRLKMEILHAKEWEYEYLIGLLHWALSSVYWIDIFPSKKRFAFMASALICQCLQNSGCGKGPSLAS